MVVTYLTTTFTTWGQAVVDEAWLARVGEGRVLLKVSRHVLEFIDIGSVIGVIVILIVVTAVRRNWRVGAVLAGGVLGAAASAELLKVVLPRPDLAPQLEAMMGEHAANSFPSGHVTIVTASVIALLAVAPVTARLPVALVGASFVACVAGSVVAAGWHRPSDAIGGLGLALAWQGLVSWWVVRRAGVFASQLELGRWFWLAVAGLMLATMTVVVVVLAHEQFQLLADSVNSVNSVNVWTFPIAEAILVGSALLAVCAAGWILREVEVR